MFETIMMTFKLTWHNWRNYDTCTYADFHKALQKYPSGEIDDFDVTHLSQIYQGIGEPITILIYEGLAKLLQK